MTAEKIIQDAIEKMSNEDRQLVLVWAQKVQDITSREDLSTGDKLRQLNDLDTAPAVRAFLSALLAALKQHLWDDRSWPARGALSGLTLGVVALGGQGAGIAALGGAIGVPLFLLTAAGGALLGTVISEITEAGSKRGK